VSHYGPMYETTDVTGWTARRLAEWIAEHPDWAEADLSSCDCSICGEVVELKRLKEQAAAAPPAAAG
jgi:hypothetical protein